MGCTQANSTWWCLALHSHLLSWIIAPSTARMHQHKLFAVFQHDIHRFSYMVPGIIRSAWDLVSSLRPKLISIPSICRYHNGYSVRSTFCLACHGKQCQRQRGAEQLFVTAVSVTYSSKPGTSVRSANPYKVKHSRVDIHYVQSLIQN